MKCRAPNARAFTLVELLVAIFIIAILVAIIVGVSSSVGRQAAREQTRSSMDVICGALDVYHEQAGAYPDEDAFTDPGPPPPGWSQRDFEAYQRIVGLYGQLDGVRRAQERLERLERKQDQRWESYKRLLNGILRALGGDIEKEG